MMLNRVGLFQFLLTLAFLLQVISGECSAQRKDGESQLNAKIKAFLSDYCVRCHGAKEAEADVRLDNIKANFSRGPQAETWHDILRVLNKGDMPPEDEKQPSAQGLESVTEWIHEQVEKAQRQNRSTGGKVILRRLTKYEYGYALQDLLGIDYEFGQDLPPDPFSKDGFQNNGQALSISPLQMEVYLEAARTALKKAIVVGEQPEVFQQTITKSYKKKKGATSNSLGPGDEFIARVMKFPREGKIRIRVKADAVIPTGAAIPQLSVSLGNKSDVKTAEEWLGSVDIQSSDSKVYEFTTRIERFPLPGHNPKFPGIMVTIRNEPDSFSTKKPKRKKNKKNNDSDEQQPPVSLLRIESVEFVGPVFDTWPPQHHQEIIPRSTDLRKRNDVQNIVGDFASRAFRRPATQTEVDLYTGYFEKLRSKYSTAEEALRETLAMVLISPQFLYQLEPHSDSRPTRLTEFELASRLSFFLWASMPDEELLALATKKKLSQPKILAQQVQRMIANPKSDRFINHFPDQWLNLSGISRVAVNPEYYPEFDERLKSEMKRETQLFFGTILRENLSALNFIDSDFAMLNRRLAKHYSLEPLPSSSFIKVKLDKADRRGGLLTQGSILLANSNGEDSHPIRRAVWLLDRLLDSPPAPPPPDVPALEPENPNFAKLSIKEQLEVHRTKEACNNCHRKIDPWGIAFENYDAVGRWRTEVTRKIKRGPKSVPVVARATLPTGQKINGMKELQSLLLAKEKDRFSRALVSKLMEYSLGRSLEITDERTVVSLTKKFADNQYELQQLIVELVQSQPFQYK